MNLVLEMRRTCIVFLVTLLLLVSSLIPVTIPVVADEDPPMFTEEDCECDATGMELVYSRVQSRLMKGTFKCDATGIGEGVMPATLSFETWNCTDSEICNPKFALDVGYILGKKDPSNPSYVMGRGDLVIIEDDTTNIDERASLITGGTNQYSGDRCFLYVNYRTTMTAEYFKDGIETKRAMDALEKCIRAVLERKQQAPTLIEDTPQPSGDSQMMGIVQRVRDAEIRQPESSDTWKPLNQGTILFEGDQVRTLQGGHLEIRVDSNMGAWHGTIRMIGNSLLVMPKKAELTKPDFLNWEAIKGRFWILIEELLTGKVEIRTPNAISRIKGTEFEIIVEENGNFVALR